MPRPAPPPPPPKGTRHPGAGRKKGQPNRITVEARQLASQLVNDVDYQHKLRVDFRRRRVHPTIESLIWAYHLGKPAQPVAVSGSMTLDVNARLEEERRVFASLDLRDLEQLAAESQGLVDRAVALAKVRADAAAIPALSPLEVEDSERKCEETLAIPSESDKGDYVNPEVSDPNPPNSPQ